MLDINVKLYTFDELDEATQKLVIKNYQNKLEQYLKCNVYYSGQFDGMMELHEKYANNYESITKRVKKLSCLYYVNGDIAHNNPLMEDDKELNEYNINVAMNTDDGKRYFRINLIAKSPEDAKRYVNETYSKIIKDGIEITIE
jgi:hypothetical protein